MALQEKFALPNKETVQDDGGMGIGLSTEVKEIGYREMSARMLAAGLGEEDRSNLSEKK